MPRAVHVVLAIAAWLSLPLWLLVAVGAWALSLRGVIILCTATAMTSFAWLALHLVNRLEELIRRRQVLEYDNMAALIQALGLLLSGPEEPLSESGEGEAESKKRLSVAS